MSHAGAENLYRFTPHTVSEKNTSRRDEVITCSKIWFSKPDAFNDPLDCRLDYRQEYSDQEIKNFWSDLVKSQPEKFPNLDVILEKWGKNKDFVEQQNRLFEQFRSNIGVACFSKTPTNILMWSHYANFHKGIVYEFSPDLFLDSISDSFSGHPMKIDYPENNEYGLLSYTLTGEPKKAQFVTEQLTKAIDWAYESEYRFIDLKESGNKQFRKESLKSIIFGAKTGQEEIDRIKQLCNEHDLSNVNFKQAKFIQGKFRIEIIDI